MNEYLDGFLKSAKKVAEVLAEKTSETVDAAKLEIEMRKVQSALDKEYKALGQIMFQVEKGALKREDSIIQTACKRIQEKMDALIELQQKKDELKAEKEKAEESVQEPDMPEEENDEEEAAGEAAKETADKTSEEAVEETPEEEVLMPERSEEGYFVLKFCPKCKVGNHPDAARCVNCGTEFPKQGDKE